MRILLSGSSGFIGSEVFSHLQYLGHQVVRLKRAAPRLAEDTLYWDPQSTSAEFENFDAVLHLAGEPIFGLWTAKKKERIRESRVKDTQALAELFLKTKNPPKVFISASAVGYYGDRGELLLTEESGVGAGFLATVCQEWEEASNPLTRKGIRVVHTRFGIVLGKKGGILQKMRLPFQYGLGAIFGTGRQWISWISLKDLVRTLTFCLQDERIVGAINCVSPHPVRQKEFAELLASQLKRPLFLRLPSAFLRLFLGRMAEELLLASQRASPQKLLSYGFTFHTPTLEGVFRNELDTDTRK